ncbi:hypothetical protein AB0D27_42120 [Streptomyces sp. NPDC048415]
MFFAVAVWLLADDFLAAGFAFGARSGSPPAQASWPRGTPG